MHVTKRDGSTEKANLNKITARIKEQAKSLNQDYINVIEVSKKVIDGLYDGVSTVELDQLAAQTAASMSIKHPDYSKLAAKLEITALHKITPATFSDCTKILYNQKIVTKDYWKFVEKNLEEIDNYIVKTRDFRFDYFGFKTLERAYLMKNRNSEIVERPQYMWMRVALGIWHKEGDLKEAFKTYDLLSKGFATHATPTLFNAATPRNQLSSCFLIQNKGDDLTSLFNTISDVAHISKWAGGIGVAISNVRAAGSYIKGTGGKSDGLMPMLRTYNEVAKWINQGGKRKGSFAMYLEPWHADVFDFIEIRKNHGKEEMRARDLFTGLWVNDLFMEAVEADSDWYLMCPNESPGLQEVHNEEFRELYQSYIDKGQYRKKIKARDLWNHILDSQIETGTPYMVYKDTCNRLSNQKNLGTIKSSNLCTEIIEYTEPNEIAVCNLASIALPEHIKDGEVDYKLLYKTTYQLTKNLNQVIDINYYPVPETSNSNLKHRPIGLGVQGLADLYATLKISFTSEEAKQINKNIFETIYYGALSASKELAKEKANDCEAEGCSGEQNCSACNKTYKGAYSSFKGSPLSEGIFHWEMSGLTEEDLSGMHNWKRLREEIKQYGVTNSLFLAPMPTASTAQILGNNEAFEAFTSNMYLRRTLSGEFIVVNKHLLSDLIDLGLWNETLEIMLKAENGSVKNLPVPEDIKERYRTVWEIKQKEIIDMAADRQAFIDQSQSMNLHMIDVTRSKLMSAHFYGWKRGLKTGMYYLRTKAAVDAIKFTVEPSRLKELKEAAEAAEARMKTDFDAAGDSDFDCIGCGS